MVFEDAPLGVEAGIAAGMQVCVTDAVFRVWITYSMRIHIKLKIEKRAYLNLDPDTEPEPGSLIHP